MRIMENFKHEELNLTGGIHQMNSDGTFTAFTATVSKVFKSYNSAVKFMNGKNYTKIN